MKQDDEISIKELFFKARAEFRYLVSKWIIIIAVGLLGGVLGYFYASSHVKLYTATFSFAMEDDKAGGGGGISSLASQFGFDMGASAGGAFATANLTELMKSRSLVEKALLSSVNRNGKAITLAEYYIEFNELRKGWEKDPELKSVEFPPNADKSRFTLTQNKILGSIYAQIVNKMLSVGPKDKKVSILYIEVTAKDELFAKYFAESLAKVVSEFYIDTKSQKSKINVAILQGQADSLRAELNSSIYGAASATDNTFNLNPALNVKRVASSRKQFDVQANTAMLVQIVQNLELAKVSLRKETPLIQPIDMPILPLSFSQVNKLKLIIQGGILASVFIIGVLLVRRWWRNLMK